MGWITLRRVALVLGLTVSALVVLLVVSLALPVRVWRTGEQPAPPLPVVDGGPVVRMPARIWIDTDAACGHGRNQDRSTSRTTDPDDCLAILLLLEDSAIEVVGISTVHGNAALSITDRTTRDLIDQLTRDGIAPPPVHRGSARSTGDNSDDGAREPAHAALRQALRDGPMTVIALGPLTNLAAALDGHPELQPNVVRLVSVMGRRPGHIFHPAEGAGTGGILFGHGPVFTDFNFAQDPVAARRVLAMALPTTFIPYEAARGMSLDAADLAGMAARGGAAAWTAAGAEPWLDYWREDIGRPGFYPFDLVAAAYVLAPERFDCAQARAWIGEDAELWHLFSAPEALLVGPDQNRPSRIETPTPSAPQTEVASGQLQPSQLQPSQPQTAHTPGRTPVIYCPQISPNLEPWLVARLHA